jgi:5-methylcytosine-specific restriction endonuclease McrA
MTIDRSRRARAARKRRRRFLAADNDLTPAQWTAIRNAWGGCAYCGELDAALQKDCVLPLSRGGRYTLENVVPACRSCNASKSNDEVTGWLRRKRLDEPRFLLRWAQIVVVLRTQLSESGGFIDLSSTNGPISES